MEASELKEYIVEKDSIVSVLEKLGCHKIKRNIRDIRCALPNRSNGTSVSVKLDNLSTTVFSEGGRVSGDIITLVSYIKDYKTHAFINSLKWLHEACGLKFTSRPTKKKEENKKDPLALFRSIVSDDSSSKNRENELKVYDDSILNSYIMKPHKILLDEGISIQSQKKYNVCYCPRSKRIVFPYRYHNGDEDSYLGASGRTTIEDYDVLDIAKYYAMPPFSKGATLYGYAEGYEGIQQSKMVVVFEGEKSVLKTCTFGYNNAVAVGSHSITPQQRSLLLGLGVEIVIAFDNDVDENEIVERCNEFIKYRKVSYIRDRDGLLDGKDSPVDKGYKVYINLLKNRIRVN